MRRGRRKNLYRRERDSLEGPHEEAEIQHKALRRGKNLAFREDTCLEKEQIASSSQFIARVVARKKPMTGDSAQHENREREKQKGLLRCEPESVKKKACKRVKL